jgi:SAM-dependent MidA family methyltransferase
VSTGNRALIETIRAKIDNDGPQPFAWFMEQALYHPEHGYYSSDRVTIGRRGDYFTNVSVGPLFGRLLARQFAEVWRGMGKIDPLPRGSGVAASLAIVEQGAHHGEFARDVLEFSRRELPDFFSALQYQIVEPFPKLQDRQSATLRDFGDRVRWRTSLDDLEPFTGIHFSNELLDAMPVNLRKRLVGIDRERFVFVDSPEQQVTNQSQLDWVANVAIKLKRGFILVIDYGFAAAEFREMIQIRTKHRLLDSPFEQIGEADITAHVNWTDIAAAAEKNGLRLAGFTDQHHFLTGIISAFPEMLDDEKSKRELQTLLHPEMLGRSFQMLCLAKDIDLGASFSGLKFARDPRAALAL